MQRWGLLLVLATAVVWPSAAGGAEVHSARLRPGLSRHQAKRAARAYGRWDVRHSSLDDAKLGRCHRRDRRAFGCWIWLYEDGTTYHLYFHFRRYWSCVRGHPVGWGEDHRRPRCALRL